MRIKIVSKLIGDENTFPLMHRVLNVIILTGIAMSFSASIFNYIIGLGVITIIVPFICGVITIGLYILSYVGKQYELPSLIAVFMLSFIFFPTMWFINGGFCGSIPYYIIINAGIIAVLVTGIKRKLIFTFFMLVVGALVVIEYRMPNLVVEYKSDLIRYQDSSFGFFICLLSIAVIVSVFVDNYISEQKKCKKYLSILKEQNKIIEAKNRDLEKSNAKLKKMIHMGTYSVTIY